MDPASHPPDTMAAATAPTTMTPATPVPITTPEVVDPVVTVAVPALPPITPVATAAQHPPTISHVVHTAHYYQQQKLWLCELDYDNIPDGIKNLLLRELQQMYENLVQELQSLSILHKGATPGDKHRLYTAWITQSDELHQTLRVMADQFNFVLDDDNVVKGECPAGILITIPVGEIPVFQ